MSVLTKTLSVAAKAVGKQSAYDRVTFHGKPMDRATMDALKAMEDILGYELTITQGIGGAAASSGTHLKGRAVDLPPWDWRNKMAAAKKVGFAVWYRPAVPGLWPEHLHMVLILNTLTNGTGIAASALRQIGSFLRGRNGLVGDGPDTTPERVKPQPIFKWPVKTAPKPRPARTGVTRTRDRLVRMEQYAAEIDVLLAKSKDPVLIEARERNAKIREYLVTSLTRMPKK